jgi:integrase/recombinase XerC
VRSSASNQVYNHDPDLRTGHAWRRMCALCAAADVSAEGVQALRHAEGTRLYAETRELEATARHLGHSKLETTRIYAKWSDRQLRETIGRW